MISKKIFNKIKPSPFLVLVTILISSTLLAYIFKNNLKKQVEPAHIAELEMNELSPDVKKLVESSNDNFLKIKTLLAKSNSTSLSANEKNSLLTLIKDTTVKMNKAVELDSENSNLWSYRCNLYRSLVPIEGALSVALESCKKSLELDPGKEDVQFILGGLYVLNKEFSNAISLFEDLTKKEPSNMNYYYNLGYAYEQSGDKIKARLSYKKAMELTDDIIAKNKLQAEIDKLK